MIPTSPTQHTLHSDSGCAYPGQGVPPVTDPAQDTEDIANAAFDSLVERAEAEQKAVSKRYRSKKRPEKQAARFLPERKQQPETELSEPVDTATLLDEVQKFITKYMVFRSVHQAVALALWVLHTYAVDAADVTPYIHVTAATKQAGKSRLLENLALLCREPLQVVSITTAALIRTIELKRPTLLLDETDAIFAGNKERAETLRGVINAGNRRGALHYMCSGENHEVVPYNVFGPKAFAGIGGLPDTVEDRAIIIEMQRKGPQERVERFCIRPATASAEPIAKRLRGWATHSIISDLRAAQPALPDALGDRQQDAWEPLLAIADLAGETWAKAAREAAKELSAKGVTEDRDPLMGLLTDIQAIFAERFPDPKDDDYLLTRDLVNALISREDLPWGSHERAKPLSAYTLRGFFRNTQVRSENVPGIDRLKGYYRRAFTDAWARYLPPPKHPLHPPHPPKPDEISDSSRRIEETDPLPTTTDPPHNDEMDV